MKRPMLERLLGAQNPPPLLDPDRFTLAGRTYTPARLIELLTPFLSPERRARIDAVVEGRTYTVVPVVEGLVNTGNVSAVMRSAEGLGYGGFHVVKGDIRYKHSERTSSGADKWLDVWAWGTPEACAAALRERGYTLIVTHLEAAVPLAEIDFTQKTALVFGNERDGVSPAMLKLADRRCIIPMPGFVQSFNISVAAAVSLYHARQDRLARQGHHGDLGAAEREALRADYMVRSVRSAAQILKQAESQPQRTP